MSLGVARYSEEFSRALGLEGQGIDDISRELVAAVVLDSDPPEWRILKGQQLCGSRADVAALAANRSQAGPFLPTGAGVLAVIHGFVCSVTGAGNRVDLHLTQTSMANLVSRFTWCDTRGAAPTDPVLGIPLQMRSDQAASAGLGAPFASSPPLAANTGYEFPADLRVVLSPGWGVVAVPTADNIGLFFSCQARVRPINPEELAPR